MHVTPVNAAKAPFPLVAIVHTDTYGVLKIIEHRILLKAFNLTNRKDDSCLNRDSSTTGHNVAAFGGFNE